MEAASSTRVQCSYQIVVTAGGEKEEDGLSVRDSVRSFFCTLVDPLCKMWSSRNRMITDNDGDDVAFLSGLGNGRLQENSIEI